MTDRYKGLLLNQEDIEAVYAIYNHGEKGSFPEIAAKLQLDKVREWLLERAEASGKITFAYVFWQDVVEMFDLFPEKES